MVRLVRCATQFGCVPDPLSSVRVTGGHAASNWLQIENARLRHYALTSAHETDFFIQREMGWALRNHARINSETIRAGGPCAAPVRADAPRVRNALGLTDCPRVLQRVFHPLTAGPCVVVDPRLIQVKNL
jgi:hypothetical protein